MNNQNFHPIQKVPPIAHALHKWYEDTKTVAYEYNGIEIISLCVSDSDDVGFRHGSTVLCKVSNMFNRFMCLPKSR